MSLNEQTRKWWKSVLRKLKPDELGLDEIFELIQDASDQGMLNMEMIQIIRRLVQYSEIRVEDIMVPRQKMIAVDRDDSIEDMIEVITRSGHSRFPVTHSKDRDKIIGILMAKDLLRYSIQDRRDFNVNSVLREAVVVPESKRIHAMLREFRQGRNHMALVVNEYGGIAGLVTLEDALEQIVGEIVDEHDIHPERLSIIQTEDNAFIVPGSCSIDELKERLPFQFEAPKEVDTVAGMVSVLFGKVPQTGERLELDHIAVTVLESDQRHVSKIKLTQLTQKP